jgi:hypothetical protein
MEELFKVLDETCWGIENKKGTCVMTLGGVEELQRRYGISRECALEIVHEWVRRRF